MFADRAKIYIRSGKGGDGHVSFRRELYVPNGGPDGGDGGRGGDVIFEVDEGQNTLGEYRHKHKFKAQDGQEGGKKRCHGADGDDIVLKVPEGTVIMEAQSRKVIADMSGENRRQIVLKGGRGGKGNQHYATPTMQAPKYAQPGGKAQELEVMLELKVIADVGLVGFPNVGKSTFINSFAGKASAKTGNKPGVTKGKQWIKLGKNVEMLDTPGILWPRFENQDVGMRLAMIGSINDNILNIEELAIDTINYVYNNYPDNIIERYELDKEAVKASYDESAINPDNSIALYIMEQAALKRGCIKKGNAIDYEKTANIILDDFRSGRLGRITLERSEDNANS